jgi:hypothetical protein
MNDNRKFAHGADAIAEVIERPLRATYYLLEQGRVPGAFKFGGSGPWSLDIQKFREGVAALQAKQMEATE